MVVYGGSPNDKSAMSGEIFMFDTISQTWTKGKAGEPRAYATCTIAGDQLLIWGGMAANKTVASGDVLVYNMGNDTWVQGYIPPAEYLNPSATTSAGADPSSTDKDGSGGRGANVGAIVGGIVGGLVVVAGVVLFLFRRRRQDHRQRDDSSASGKDLSTTNRTNNNDGTSAIEKLHATGYGTPSNKSLKEEKEELQTLREQLEAQKKQQAALQRQVEELKSQHAQDAVYGYQPPTYYPPGTSSTIPTQPVIFQPYPEQGPVVYNPTSPPPPVPPRIPVTTELSSGNVPATVSSILGRQLRYAQSSKVRAPDLPNGNDDIIVIVLLPRIALDSPDANGFISAAGDKLQWYSRVPGDTGNGSKEPADNSSTRPCVLLM
ncbi:hypothetical protein KI688_003149 [Linnemannia hyalina]|uniref:Galactose oxidase n=1 Tax=Linnemannia hyalina TaxID=64524 RepID=A0A9P8BTE7_9FUNG|nr:hypothetical protein KI688_003149 [Linnemannia hyalina]